MESRYCGTKICCTLRVWNSRTAGIWRTSSSLWHRGCSSGPAGRTGRLNLAAMRRGATRETDVIIRVPFGEIATKYEPYFARCNSGATRMQNGKPVVRGPSAFLKGKECSYSPSEVVEVTFLGDVGLPSCTEVAHSLDGPWTLLFGSLPNFSSSGRAEARRST